MKLGYGAWRSLVARTAGGREVAGSNPVAPIWRADACLFYLLRNPGQWPSGWICPFNGNVWLLRGEFASVK